MYEAERKKFYNQLEKVDVLIVGESRPNGGTFFYFKDSILYKYIREEMARYTRLNFYSFDCLNFMKLNNIFLDDLNLEPVNHLPARVRAEKNRNAVGNFSERLKSYKPRVIICVVKCIIREITNAINLSGTNPEKVFFVSFPAQGQQNNFRREFYEALNGALPNYKLS